MRGGVLKAHQLPAFLAVAVEEVLQLGPRFFGLAPLCWGRRVVVPRKFLPQVGLAETDRALGCGGLSWGRFGRRLLLGWSRCCRWAG